MFEAFDETLKLMAIAAERDKHCHSAKENDLFAIALPQ
jgi:hypothetical protein